MGIQWKGVAVNLALMVLSVLISLTVGEVAVRQFTPKFSPEGNLALFAAPEGKFNLGPKNSTVRHWTRTGDFDVIVRFNRYGLRDSKDFAESTAADWFVVGDSFTMGWGVNEWERYSDIIASRLGVKAYNVATPGDLASYEALVRYVRDNGATMKRLIVGVCMANDLADYETGIEIYRSQLGRLAPIKVWIENRSALYVALATLVHTNDVLREAAHRLGLMHKTLDVISTNVYSDTALISSANKVTRMVRGTDSSYVVIIPSQALWVGANQSTERLIHERFTALLRERELSVIDLRPAFEAAGNPNRYFFNENAHWNAAGHALVGEVIARRLADDLARMGSRIR